MKRILQIISVFLFTALWSISGFTQTPIDINHASLAELQKIPYIGAAKAQAIIDEREKNGPFLDTEDVLRTPGIGKKILKLIAPFIEIEPKEEISASRH